jgi:predicted RNase H-like HicB family nuclease
MSTEWSVPDDPTYRVRVWIALDDYCYEYIASCPDLPGCASEGYTYEEALANIRKAFTGAVLAYRDAGEKIPWVNGGQRPRFTEEEVLYIPIAETEP